MKGNVEKFWKAHAKSAIAKIPLAKDLLTKMLTFDPKDRIDIEGIKAHGWMAQPVLKQMDLIAQIKDRHRKAEKKRRQDVRKMNDLANSINPNRPIPGIEKATLRTWPEDYGMECLRGEVYTYLTPGRKWYDLYNFIEEAVASKEGDSTFNFEKGILNCKMNLMDNNQQAQELEFSVEIFRSREWKDQYKKLDEADEIEEANEHEIFITKISRVAGDRIVYDKLKKGFLLMHCANVLKGLPQWARDMQEDQDQANSKVVVEEDDQKEDAANSNVVEEEDDYDAILAKEAQEAAQAQAVEQ